MDPHSLKFAELVSSRLCHDLITPVGAINTGLELLADIDAEGADKDDVMRLIHQSAKTASARLSFYRMTFGSSGQQLSIDEAWEMIGRFADTSKIELHLENPDHVAERGVGRLMLTVFLWAHECLPRGGVCTFSLKSGGELVFRAEGSPLIIQEQARDALLGHTPLNELTPRSVPGALVHNLVHKMDKVLALDVISPTEMIIVVR